MNRPKISIIVPVYKAEPYLARCIESILAQDYENYELILVDDGSPDNSGSICDQYARTDSRISVLHKKNEGVSAARNDGIEKAQGEYLLFIDADDELDTHTLSGNVPYMDQSQTDLIEYPAIYNYQDSSERKITNPNREITGKKKCQAYISTCNRYEVWSFFIRRSTIQDIRFKTHIRIGEDTIFLYEILSNVKKVTISGKGCYHHYRNNGSAMNSLSTSQKEKTKVQLLSEVFHATTEHPQTAIVYFYPYFRQLHHHEIESQELRNMLEELLQLIHWRTILTSPLALKSRILILWMYVSQLIHRKP